MLKKINPQEILEAAQQLIARYGKNAISVAQERVNEAALTGCLKTQDTALMVLTQVEKLLSSETLKRF
jgi:3-keto-L-gulonate-6-phosphate decarboxylase